MSAQRRPNLQEAANRAANPDSAQADAPVPARQQPAAIAMLEQAQGELKKALPHGVSVERFVRVATTAFRRTPRLMELAEQPEGRKSLMEAIHRCAQMGLEPNSDLGHCYLLPYGKNVQFILGYKGILEMARRSGSLATIDVHEVYDNDDFEITYGLNGQLIHKPLLKGDRGSVYAYYGFAKFQDGGYYYTHMTLADIEERKQRSSSVKGGRQSPWDTDAVAMSKKTVVRAMAPYLPLAAAELDAIALDDGVIDGTGDVSFIDVGAVQHTPAQAEPENDPPQGELVDATAAES